MRRPSLRRRGWRGPFALAGLVALGGWLGWLAPQAGAALRDTAVYPISGHAAPSVPVPPLGFENQLEIVLPGLPSRTPLWLTEDGSKVMVQTEAGSFVIDPSGARQEVQPTGRERPVPTCAWPGGKAPRWVARVTRPDRPSWCAPGPDRIVAMLSADGSILGRDRKNGHLLWRRVASHRLSRPGARFGDYLLVAADTARTLQALRWYDGSVAGVFQLSSEDAAFASPPLVLGDRVYILSVKTPLQETRLLVLRPTSLGTPAAVPPAQRSAPR